MVDPIDYGAPLRSGILTGLQGGSMLQGIGMRNRQMQQEEQQQQAMQQFQRDWQQAYASGDPQQLDALVAKYPGQMETVQKVIGFRDDNHRTALGNAARDLRIALASKQPGAVGRAAQANADALSSIGSSPEDILQMLQTDPQGLARIVDTVGMGALGVKDYYDVQDKLQGRGIAQQNANTSTFSAQQNARQGDERLAIDRYKAQSGADLAAEELKLKALLGKAQNDTARGNLQQKLDVVNKARDEKINSVAGNVADFGRAAAVGTELGSLVNQHPSAVSRNQGGLIGWAPNVADDTRTLASKTDEYNLKVILPALKGTFGGNPTEGERAALMQSSNNLKKATSNEDFLKELNKAQDTIVQMQKRQIRGLGIPVTRSQDEATDTQMLLSDPSLVEEYIRAHGYLPESYYQAQLKGAK